jgi:hypothetical protein
MNMANVNLETLAYDKANFAHSERDPTSLSPAIRGHRPFYYMWTKNEGMEILTFDDPTNPQTAKLFKYNREQLFLGVDLSKDKPKYVGDAVVNVLKKYANR